MDLVLGIHSVVRWLVVLAALAAIVLNALVWLRGYRNPGMERGIRAAFTGLLDLQVVLGVILLIGLGLLACRIEHAIVMLLAVALAHSSAYWPQADARVAARNNLLTIVGVLLLVAIGISLLPQGFLG